MFSIRVSKSTQAAKVAMQATPWTATKLYLARVRRRNSNFNLLLSSWLSLINSRFSRRILSLDCRMLLITVRRAMRLSLYSRSAINRKLEGRALNPKTPISIISSTLKQCSAFTRKRLPPLSEIIIPSTVSTLKTNTAVPVLNQITLTQIKTKKRRHFTCPGALTNCKIKRGKNLTKNSSNSVPQNKICRPLMMI